MQILGSTYQGMLLITKLQLLLIASFITTSTFTGYPGLLTIKNLCKADRDIKFQGENCPEQASFLSEEERDIPIIFEENSAKLLFRCGEKRLELTINPKINHITVSQVKNTITLTNNIKQVYSFVLE